jgi:eukaryotic-like serine/threonine-protein kinase
LDAVVESVDESNELWRREKVTFRAAYNNERMFALVFVPRHVPPPYQVVVYYPHSGALRTRSSGGAMVPQQDLYDFVVRSGRMVVHPALKSTLERGDGLLSDRPNMTATFREHIIQWCQDIGRTIDYMATREDADMGRVGYYGISWGAVMGAIVPALEPRISACVLVVGGFWQQRGLAETEQLNFAPRVTVPVLMLNGRHDVVFPEETSQRPMFRFLGTSPERKKHLLYETGHWIPRNEMIKETLNWLDEHLGRVD